MCRLRCRIASPRSNLYRELRPLLSLLPNSGFDSNPGLIMPDIFAVSDAPDGTVEALVDAARDRGAERPIIRRHRCGLASRL